MTDPASIKKIDILLTTYNGDLYLRQLLDSVIGQSFTNWQLLIRDDGSQDGTLQILHDYAQRYPHQITLMPNDTKRLRPCLSFGRLMELSSAPYVMFCDQDDVWLKEKIKASFDKILELEGQYGEDVPLLVHTDASLTDKDLKVIANSAHLYMGIDPKIAAQFRNLILHNVIVGNTVILNRSLVKLSTPVPANAIMHDWWVGIIASAWGHIGYVPIPTILYRKHEHNTCGLRQRLWEYLLNIPKYFKKYYLLQGDVVKQMHAFYERFKNIAPQKEGSADKEILLVSGLIQLDKFDRRKQRKLLFTYYKDCPYRLRTILDLVFYYKIYK